MSQDFERLIGRAVVDKKFRDALLADPEKAVQEAGFKLTADEMKRVKAGLANVKATLISDQIDQMFETAGGVWF